MTQTTVEYLKEQKAEQIKFGVIFIKYLTWAFIISLAIMIYLFRDYLFN